MLIDRRFLVLAAPRANSLFQRPVTLSNLYIRHPERFPLLFHVSDTVQFGLTSDLMSYWEGPPYTAEQVLLPSDGSLGLRSRIRFFPEQAATLRWLEGHGIVPVMRHGSALNPAILKTWGEILARNFLVLDWRKTGIDFPERFVSDPSVISTLLDAETAARPEIVMFSYRKALLNRFFSPTYLVHGKLGPTVSLLKTRFPGVYLRLRTLWIAYQKCRRQFRPDEIR